jgi:hypothetical protein
MWPFKRKPRSREENVDAANARFDANAHPIVLAYLRRLWAGEPPDPVFEAKSLSRELRFNTLSLAEVMFALSKERGVPVDTISDFLACGIPGGGDIKTANLLKRIAILADSFSEEQRDDLIAAGIVGDPSEIAPISAEFDNVGFVVKYCRAVASLKDSKEFGRRDGGYVDVEADPGWQ